MRLQQTFGANDEIDNTMVNIPDETLSIVPVDIRRHFNVDTTSCVYWDSPKLAMGQPRGRQKTNQLYTLDPVLTLLSLLLNLKEDHCAKSVQIRSFFWSVFSCIRTEYGDLRSIYTYICVLYITYAYYI